MAPLLSRLGVGGGGFGFGKKTQGGVSIPSSATGGDIDNLQPGNGYAYHTFTTTGPGTFTVTDGPLDCEILVIAGGGAGGAVDGGGGGGGAGGVARCSSLVLANGTYPLSVGAGQLQAASAGGTGTPSVFYSPAPTTGGRITALGGGKGAYGPRSGGAPGTPGGSGGGGQGFQATAPGGSATQPGQSNPPNTTNYGNAGAIGFLSGSGFGGGGGGAGTAGKPDGKSGGDGIQFLQFSSPLSFIPTHPYLTQTDRNGTPMWDTGGYFGGGGASAPSVVYPPGTDGGIGGGGTSKGPAPSGILAGDGADGLGGGGGHAPIGTPLPQQAKGGNGIIIIRYLV